MHEHPAEGEYFILEGLRPMKANFAEWVVWSNETGGEGFEVGCTRVINETGKLYDIRTAFSGICDPFYKTQVFPAHPCAEYLKSFKTLLDAQHGHHDSVIELVRKGIFVVLDQE